jgi:hypothetical protein
MLIYVLSENGMLSDFYNSDPGFLSGKNKKPSGGEVVELLKICTPGTTEKTIATLLRKKRPFKAKPHSKGTQLAIEQEIAARKKYLILPRMN